MKTLFWPGVFGLLAGFLSLYATVFPSSSNLFSIGFFLPGVIFGSVMAPYFLATSSVLEMGYKVVAFLEFVAISFFAYLFALITNLLLDLPYADGWSMGSITYSPVPVSPFWGWSGFFLGGCIGGFLLAMGARRLFKYDMRTGIAVITLVGGVLGLVGLVNIFVLFPVWQMGVAVTMGIVRSGL